MEGKKKRKQVDMLHGSLLDKILLFALPLAASSILQQLFNSVECGCGWPVCQQSGAGGGRL